MIGFRQRGVNYWVWSSAYLKMFDNLHHVVPHVYCLVHERDSLASGNMYQDVSW